MSRICVYSGSSFGASTEYANAAAAFGAACARRGLGIVYGGGSVGLMGVLADAALAAGGEVIGVIPRAMIAEERAHHSLTKLIAVDSMHERKQQMAELADAFVAIPGGIGTLEEVIEVFTWLQVGLHLKPVGLLNVCGFYDLLLQFLAHIRDEQFLTPAHHTMLTIEDNAESLLNRLTATRHTLISKPVTRAIDIWIREINCEDLPRMYEMQLDPESNRLAITIPRTAEAFSAHWEKALRDPSVTARAIVVNEVFVGNISCFKLEGLDSVGYWIEKEYWGKGIATRALELLLNEVALRPLHARVATSNAGSLRVLRKCGFETVRTQTAPADDRFPECEETVLILR